MWILKFINNVNRKLNHSIILRSLHTIISMKYIDFPFPWKTIHKNLMKSIFFSNFLCPYAVVNVIALNELAVTTKTIYLVLFEQPPNTTERSFPNHQRHPRKTIKAFSFSIPFQLSLIPYPFVRQQKYFPALF